MTGVSHTSAATEQPAISFDEMAQRFTARVAYAAEWKYHYFGAAYSTRIKAAIADLRGAIKDAESHEEIGAGSPLIPDAAQAARTSDLHDGLFLSRTAVRSVLIGQPDDNLHITEHVLFELDQLPVFTAAEVAAAAQPPAAPVETCPRCDGSGLRLNSSGEPDECRECKGNTVVQCSSAGTAPVLGPNVQTSEFEDNSGADLPWHRIQDQIDAWAQQTLPPDHAASIMSWSDRLAQHLAGNGDDYSDDPASDERWQAGCDYALMRLCDVLGVDMKSVRWDAATETLDGDVCAVIWNILVAKYGDGFDPSHTFDEPQTPVKLGDLVEMNHLCPYRDDYRGAEMKLISLRLGPDGEQWATVVEGDPRHRGYGVYDAETDGIRVSLLSPLSRPHQRGGE